MLDLYKLEIFALVAQLGSFSEAAEGLHMTQSGVSQHIRDLENRLGTQLFKRGRRGVTLTPAGLTLHQYASKILHLAAEAENAVTNVENLTSGELTIGATPGAGVYLLPDWIQAFRSRFPNLTVTLRTDITSQIVRDLRARRLDLGFLEGELDVRTARDLVVIDLQAVDQCVIIGRQHPWWGRTSVRIEELNGQSFVMRQRKSQTRIWLDGMLQQYGVQPRVIAEFDNLESIKRVVASGMALTILPEYAVRQEIALGLVSALPIQDQPLQRTLKMAQARAMPLTPIARAFLKQLSTHFPQLQEDVG